MRCPKCQYITFDSGERCRNCGYEFSFSPESPDLDLPIQTGEEAEGPLNVPDTIPPQSITQSFDLPLFHDRGASDDRPLISAPAVPRAPLSVRKPSPALQRAPGRRGGPPVDEPQLDLALPEEVEEPQDHRPAERPRISAARPAESNAVAHLATASVPARLFAALVDALLLGAIDLGVLHLTLKICRLDYTEIDALPIAPFVSFLLILNGGYLSAFTAAGGQSIGKMAARIKVVPSDPDAWTDRVPLGQAILRAVSYLVSALPAGLGFLPALIGEKRALHDRLAHTRVVKA